MPTEKELMLKQADAETTYQKKLTAGTNITIDPVTNIISSAGGGSTVQYTDNTPNGESVGILAINGQSHPVRIPKLAEGTGITINKDITTNVYTISLSGGGGGTTKTYMGETNPDELVGEDGDLYFKYHKITTVIPTELTLPSLPDDTVVPFPITNFNSYDSFTFYCTDPSLQTTTINLNIGDIPIGDNPAELTPESEIHRFNTFYYAQVSRSTDGEGLVFRVGRNVLFKLEANVTEIDLGIDKSYAKVEDTWLPSGEQVEANPEETSETPLTKIKIDGVTYYIAAGGSAEIVPLTKAEWDALPASKYTDDILYLITDSFTTDTIITPNPEGEATDTLTKLQIDETIYDLAGESGAAAIEKTQSEYNALTPAQKENGAIYMVQAGEQPQDTSGTFVTGSTQYEKVEVNCGFRPDYIEVTLPFSSGDTTAIYDASVSTTTSTWEIPQESNKYTIELGSVTGETGITDIIDTGFKFRCNASNTRGVTCTFTASKEGQDAVNKIYYMGTEYANTNGGSGGGGEGYTETILWSGSETTNKWVEPIVLNDIDVDAYDALAIQVNVSQHIVSTEQIPIGDASASSIIGVNGFLNTNGENVVGIWLNKGNNLLRIFTATNVTIVVTKVVGIKYGSGGGSESANLKPFIFDKTEYKVGEWTNGKTIYQKTIELSSPITIDNTSAEISWGSDVADMENIISAVVHRRDEDTTYGSATSAVMARKSNGKILLYSGVSFNDAKYITLQYTRTVDNDSPWHTINVGGGRASYEETSLFSGQTASTGEGVTVNLNGNISDHDAIVIDCGRYGEGAWRHGYIWYLTSDISIGQSFLQIIDTNDNATAYWFYDADTSITWASAYNAYPVTLFSIKGIKFGSGGGGSEGEGVEIYSENEYIVGKWIDGKKLYQKTIDFGAMPAQGDSKSVAHNISDIDKIISWEAFGVNQSGEVMFVPNVSRGNVASQTSMSVNSTNVYIFNGSRSELTSEYNGYVTIRYTKTVETPAPAWGGSVNNYYANFIDTDNVIQAETQVSSGTTGTYTATKDCYIRAKLWRSSEGGASLSIDGVEVLTNYSNSGTTALYNTIPLKKGQTATIDAGAGSPCSYTVYGISYGSGGSSSESSIEYSTEEKEVGTWIDGSKIYQKTFVLSSFTSGTITINASDLNIKNLVDANGEADFIQNDEIVESLKLPHYISGQANSTIRMAFGNIQILHTGLNEYTNGYVTIQYTKTTD